MAKGRSVLSSKKAMIILGAYMFSADIAIRYTSMTAIHVPNNGR
jgi:hypothetical protein